MAESCHETCVEKWMQSAVAILANTACLVAFRPTRRVGPDGAMAGDDDVDSSSLTIAASCSASGRLFQPHCSVIPDGSLGLPTTRAPNSVNG